MSILEPIVEFVANFFGDVVHAETDKNAKRWLLVGALALVITFPLGLLWGTHIENDGVPFVIWMSLGLSLASTVAVIRAAKPEQAWTFPIVGQITMEEWLVFIWINIVAMVGVAVGYWLEPL